MQNYVDQAAGSDYQDFMCNKLTYDKHDGIDIRLPTRAEMDKGVKVLAAADGAVLNVRDEMADISVRKIDRNTIKDKECGNGVVIDHADGWQTQYCHMMKGSVIVHKGQTVKAGDPLGLIGLSGDTEFPHVHVSVRKDGAKVDPYTGGSMETGCGKGTKSLWSATAAEAMQYRDTGVLKTGFIQDVPKYDDVMDGKFSGTEIKQDAPMMIFWSLLYGLHTGDVLSMKLTDPQGNIAVSKDVTLDRAKAQYFQFIGKKRKTDPWAKGTYTGLVSVLRDGKTVAESRGEFLVD
ncbi:MAG: M23 family metallopeptidase [Rickettsiales bacterium]